MRPIEKTLPRLQYIKNLHYKKTLRASKDSFKEVPHKKTDNPNKDLRVLEIGTIKMTFTLEQGHLLYNFS